MAIITRRCAFGKDAIFTFVYDDVAMKLVGLDVDNKSPQKIFFSLLSPVLWSINFESGGVGNRDIPLSIRPTWNFSTIKGKSVIRGFSWKATLVK